MLPLENNNFTITNIKEVQICELPINECKIIISAIWKMAEQKDSELTSSQEPNISQIPAEKLMKKPGTYQKRASTTKDMNKEPMSWVGGDGLSV